MAEDSLDRMGAFDAVMWGIEEDPILRSVIVALVVLDREPDTDVLVDRVTRMSLAVPRLRQRVIGNPVSLVPPRWEVDPFFDISYHLKRYHVPADGTFRPVLRIAEQMAEQDFDRDRPLWEMALVQGFDGDRSAVIVKLHHAITDGVGGLAMSAALFDLTRDPATDLGPLPPAPRADVLDASGRLSNGLHFATRAVTSAGAAVARGAADLAGRVVTQPVDSAVAGSAFAQSAARLLAPASEPLSPLMHGRSLSCEMAVLHMPFRALRDAGRAQRATLNDAFVAAVAGGVAAYHEAHNAPAREVRVNMPVSMRTGGDLTAGNRWVPARFPLPLDTGDTATRIRRLSPILARARREPALALSDTIYRALAVLPRSLTTSITAGMMKGCDLAITNLPGPPVALFAAGAEALAVVPFAPKAGAAANIALMTYHGSAFVGVTIDTRAIPDPAVFVEHLAVGFEQVLVLGDPQARAQVGFHSGARPEPVGPGA